MPVFTKAVLLTLPPARFENAEEKNPTNNSPEYALVILWVTRKAAPLFNLPLINF